VFLLWSDGSTRLNSDQARLEESSLIDWATLQESGVA
jgi:hypothetical protein